MVMPFVRATSKDKVGLRRALPGLADKLWDMVAQMGRDRQLSLQALPSMISHRHRERHSVLCDDDRVGEIRGSHRYC